VRTGEIAAIAAQEHADVHLVLLALEPAEEALDAFPAAAVAVDDEALLVLVELGPRHVEADAALGDALQFGELRAVVRLAPRLDRVLLDLLRGIRAGQGPVELCSGAQ